MVAVIMKMEVCLICKSCTFVGLNGERELSIVVRLSARNLAG